MTTPAISCDFDELLRWLRATFLNDRCEYSDAKVSFCAAIKQRLPSERASKRKRYGVYICWSIDRSDVAIYVGKGGTIDSKGSFKPQDLLGRLTNVRTRDVPADNWFAEMIEREGAISVEFFVLEPPWLPSFVEAALLQSYFTRHGRLPPWNKSF